MGILSFVLSLESKTENGQQTPDSNTNPYTTFWFIGLEFKTTGDLAVDLDLTEPIQIFTDRGKINEIVYVQF